MTDSQKWLVIFSLLFAGVLIYLLSPILMPFMVSALLAYLGDPLVDRLEERKFSRTLAVTTVFLGILLVLLLIPVFVLPILEHQISTLILKLPIYMDWLQNQGLAKITAWLGLDPGTLDLEELKQAFVQEWKKAGGILSAIMSSATQSGLAMVAMVANVVLVPVVTFYLLRDWDVLTQHVRELFPRRYEQDMVMLAKNADGVLGAFLRGQLTVMVALGAVYSIGLWLVGLDFGFLIGMTAGVVSFVPYLGFIVGIVLASVVAYIQFQEFMPLLWVALVFGVGQMLEGMVLTPLLVGDKIGLHPVAVIFAVLAGGQLFGFVGILLALPVAAVIMVLLRYAHERYRQSHLYSKSS